MFRLVLISSCLFLLASCKTVGTQTKAQSEVVDRDITPAETQAISDVVSNYYSTTLIINEKPVQPAIAVSSETLEEFSRRLVEVPEGQTDIETFRKLLDQRASGKAEQFSKYIVQEFATKTNFFDVLGLMKMKPNNPQAPVVVVR